MLEIGTVKTILNSFSDGQETEIENRQRKEQDGNQKEQKEKHRHPDKRGKKPKSRSPTNRSQDSRDNLNVPYGFYDEEGSSNTYDNQGYQGNTTADESEWEKISVNSISL